MQTTTARADAPRGTSSWRAPIVWWLGVAAFDSLTAVVRGVHTSAQAARWWWSIDDQVPERTARWLLDGAHGLLLPGWHASDRGPLQPILLLWAGRWSTNPVPAYFTGIVVNGAWVLGLWYFLRVVGVTEARIRWTVLLVASTGSIWLNTVYPWPKLLSGALALACAAAVLTRRPVLAGALGALALVAHGAALFALVGLLPWAISRLRKRAVLAVLVLLAIYAPWYAFVRLVDPPGDRLVKWHLAGTDITSPDPRNPLRSIASAYKHAGLDVIDNKLRNLRFALGDPTISEKQAALPKWEDGGVIGNFRAAQVTRIIWAPGVLLLGLFFGWKRVPRTVWAMLAAWLAAYVLLEWGGNRESLTWLHTAPMCLVIGWVAVCALASPRWMLPIQVAVFVGIWLLAPSVF